MSPNSLQLPWPDASRVRTLALALSLAIGSGATLAQPRSGEAPPQGRGGPPAEALAACQTLKTGDACQFAAAQATVEGTCAAPQGRPLACRPANAPEPGAAAPRQ